MILVNRTLQLTEMKLQKYRMTQEQQYLMKARKIEQYKSNKVQHMKGVTERAVQETTTRKAKHLEELKKITEQTQNHQEQIKQEILSKYARKTKQMLPVLFAAIVVEQYCENVYRVSA